jgi:adenylylsulfate kinase-like enzyme
VGRLVWITGLPGSGKTTLGIALVEKLRMSGEIVIHLDGDQLRNAIKIPTGYDLNSRKLLAHSYQSLSKLILEQNVSVVVTTVSMFHEIHSTNRSLFQNYYEIFLDVDLEFRILSDREMLYSESKNVPGSSQEVELPKNADLTLRIDKFLGRQKWLDQAISLLESEDKHDY